MCKREKIKPIFPQRCPECKSQGKVVTKSLSDANHLFAKNVFRIECWGPCCDHNSDWKPTKELAYKDWAKTKEKTA